VLGLQSAPPCPIKTIKHLEEQVGTNIGYLRLGEGFLNMTPKAKSLKEKN
jgi:hypothetical protein